MNWLIFNGNLESDNVLYVYNTVGFDHDQSSNHIILIIRVASYFSLR